MTVRHPVPAKFIEATNSSDGETDECKEFGRAT